MSHFKSIIYFFLLCFLSGVAVAQQVPMYSQYIMNGFLVNPSLAGRDGYVTANVTVREQWMGMKGSPSTYAASIQSSILQNSFMTKSVSVRKRRNKPSKTTNVGVGGYVFNDNNGIMRRTGIQAAYAYHIPMARRGKGLVPDNLSLGLALVAYQYAINTEGLLYSYADDPYLNSYDKSVFIPDFNFGASYASSTFYAGFSMTNILRGSLIFANSYDTKRMELGHYFLTGGFNIPVNRDWTIKPSAFIKASDLGFKSMQLDLTSRVFYKEDYWAGLSYRTNDAIIFMMGLRYDKFYFGYAFDFTLTDIRNQSIGSMELTLAVKFGDNSRRYRWLNSF
jgi:type IX secretion system PorP/SprF family membrane protein